MSSTGGGDFVKKAHKRLHSQSGDIFVKEKHVKPQVAHTPQPAPDRPVVPSSSKPSRLTRHHMSRQEKINFIVMRSLGNFLLLLSLYGVAATFGPALYFEVQFQVIQARGIHFTVKESAKQTPQVAVASAPEQSKQPVSPGFGDILSGAKEQVLVPPDTTFSIVIPKIGATAKVIPNVDPNNEADYLPKLLQGVAHAKGSVFPGMQGSVYLFAHSTDNFWDVGRYNAVFYLLKDLKPGDQIVIFFENRRYNYKVDYSVIKDPSDVDYLLESQKPGKQQLILQTCWPPGTAWKRLFVIATPQ